MWAHAHKTNRDTHIVRSHKTFRSHILWEIGPEHTRNRNTYMILILLHIPCKRLPSHIIMRKSTNQLIFDNATHIHIATNVQPVCLNTHILHIMIYTWKVIEIEFKRTYLMLTLCTYNRILNANMRVNGSNSLFYYFVSS